MATDERRQPTAGQSASTLDYEPWLNPDERVWAITSRQHKWHLNLTHRQGLVRELYGVGVWLARWYCRRKRIRIVLADDLEALEEERAIQKAKFFTQKYSGVPVRDVAPLKPSTTPTTPHSPSPP